MPQFFGGIHDIDITGIMNLMNCDTDTGVIFFYVATKSQLTRSRSESTMILLFPTDRN